MTTKPIYEGKAKILYNGPQPDTIIQYFKDDATAFNKQKFDVIAGKGLLNNLISSHMMKLIEAQGIPTHFIEQMSDREQLVKRVEIIPLEVIVRNFAAGTLVKRYGLEDRAPLARPLIEFCYKKDELGDPLVTEDHIEIFGWATVPEIQEMKVKALKINQILQDIFGSIGITLADFKIEFGRYQNTILLADEMSPDNCRLWDQKTGERMDKDRFRLGLGSLTDFYAEVGKRLGLEKQITKILEASK